MEARREGICRRWRAAQATHSLLLIMPDIFPTVSQTCSLWGTSKEQELEKCKEDLQDTDMDKISRASSRIAKVTLGCARGASVPSAGCKANIVTLGVTSLQPLVHLIHLY